MKKITPITNIPELFAQLPADQINSVDIYVLQAIKACTHALRSVSVDTSSTGWLFPPEVCSALAKELNEALAQIIRMRIPKAPRVPARPVGRPRNEAAQAANTFKVHINNLINALRTFSTRMATHWDADLVPPLRRSLVSAAASNVRNAFNEMELAVPPESERLVGTVESMRDEYLTRFEQAVDNWINNGRQLDNKNDGLHKHQSITAWIDACRALAGINALYLQSLK